MRSSRLTLHASGNECDWTPYTRYGNRQSEQQVDTVPTEHAVVTSNALRILDKM